MLICTVSRDIYVVLGCSTKDRLPWSPDPSCKILFTSPSDTYVTQVVIDQLMQFGNDRPNEFKNYWLDYTTQMEY